MKRLRLVPAKPNIPFLKARFVSYAFSGALVIGTLILLLTRGLAFGIDFTGGTVLELRFAKPVETALLRESLNNLGLGEVTLQGLDTPQDVMVRFQTESEDSAAQKAALDTVKRVIESEFDPQVEYRKVDYVGPQVGRELIMSGAVALGLALLGIMVYIWFRFEWQYGVGALLSSFHDLWITLGFFALTGLEFNLTSIAAILTILGYSINDTVVIYDRIRDNLRKYKQRRLYDVIDLSLNETLSRTVLTGGSALASLVALMALGGNAIFGFSAAMFFGVIIGTYSSLYVAGPTLLYVGLRDE